MENKKLSRILSRESEEQENYAAIDKLKIGIIGISNGAGVSFISTSLARCLSNTRKHVPAVVEIGKPSIYDSIGMDKRFSDREYFYFFRAMEKGLSIRGKRNMDEGINWMIKSPEEYKIDLNYDHKLRLLNGAVCDILLCDFSGCDQDYIQLLKFMDISIVVIDPLPSKMLEGYEKLLKLKALYESGHSVLYIINKFNKGVNSREMMDFLRVKKPIFLPMVNMECIYTAEYNCKVPYSITEIKKQLQESIVEIINTLKF